MTAIVLALICAVSYGVADFWGGLATRRGSIWKVLPIIVDIHAVLKRRHYEGTVVSWLCLSIGMTPGEEDSGRLEERYAAERYAQKMRQLEFFADAHT